MADSVAADRAAVDLRAPIWLLFGVEYVAEQRHALRAEWDDCGADSRARASARASRGFELRQVLINLVSNAVIFTEQGRIAIRVERKEEAGNLFLHFSVADTGVGIPPDKQEAIFAAFTQADSTTTRQYGGTGLGLSICTRLVQMMDGRIWVESEVGQGSTFHFTVRMEQATDDVVVKENAETP